MEQTNQTDELLAGSATTLRRGFGSDNQSGVHAAVLEAMAAVNIGHAEAYGDDPWTAEAERLIGLHFGAPCVVSIVFNGTGANIVGIEMASESWSSILCADSAHINTDECGALEHVIGKKIVPIKTEDGKLTPELVRPYLTGFGFEHHSEPKIISISNLTELGTLYTAHEIRRLADLAHEYGMLLHMDGARLGNAAAALGCDIADITGKAGVDILSFGGTKNGMMGAEAVVFSERVNADRIRYVRKQNLQLASKQRFMAAQFIGALQNDIWLQCASHANTMAAQLVAGAKSAGIQLQYDPAGNEIFAILPKHCVPALQERFRFYTWIEDIEPGYDSIRWVCSFDTTQEDIDELVSALKDLPMEEA